MPNQRAASSSIGELAKATGLKAAGSRFGWRGASPGRFLQSVLPLLGALLVASRPVPCFAEDVRQIVDAYARSAV
jgi:hypothetical protein